MYLRLRISLSSFFFFLLFLFLILLTFLYLLLIFFTLVSFLKLFFSLTFVFFLTPSFSLSSLLLTSPFCSPSPPPLTLPSLVSTKDYVLVTEPVIFSSSSFICNKEISTEIRGGGRFSWISLILSFPRPCKILTKLSLKYWNWRKRTRRRSRYVTGSVGLNRLTLILSVCLFFRCP